LFQNGAIHPSLIRSANDTPAIIDLSRGNAFQVHTDTAHDWNRIHAVRPGTFFTFNTIGPANGRMGGSIDSGTFGLSAGRNISLHSNTALHFTVDSHKQAVEVGDDSQTIGLQTRSHMDGAKLAAGESFDISIELPGIQPGDVVTATPDQDMGKEVVWNSFVPANDIVTVRITNISSFPIAVTPRRFSVAGRRIP
jgi:hypothetical protein